MIKQARDSPIDSNNWIYNYNISKKYVYMNSKNRRIYNEKKYFFHLDVFINLSL